MLVEMMQSFTWQSQDDVFQHCLVGNQVTSSSNLEDDKLLALQTTICETDGISISLLWGAAIFYTAVFWGDAIKRRQMIS